MITNINNIVQNTRHFAFRGNNGKTRPAFFEYNMPQMTSFGSYSDRFERQNVNTKKAGSKQTQAKKSKAKNPFRKISYNKAKNMLTIDKIEKVQGFICQNIDKLKSTIPADQNPVIEGMFEIDGKKYDAQYSGGGGTKNTFQIRHNGEKYIVALPTYVDAPYFAGNKWLDVLEFEPKNTKLMRDEGLRTNDIFDIIPVKVAGVEFPAVLMKPYSEHSFSIADKKNYSFVNLLSLEELERLSDDEVVSMYGEVAKDIAKLTALGIKPHYDCINLCLQKGISPGITKRFRLYLNDLDKEINVKRPDDNTAERYIKEYSYLAMTALPQTVNSQMQQWCDYFQFLGCNDALQKRLEKMATRQYEEIIGR